MPVIFKSIKPKKKLNPKVFEEELRKAAEPVADGMLRDYQAGVKDWNHKVIFEKKVEVDLNGGVRITVDTDDEIYLYNHEGTSPHVIRARNAETLAFPSTYTAKTAPGRIASNPGGSSGSTVFAPMVNHPGSEGRKQTIPIKAKWRPFFGRQMQRALDKAAVRSGHSIR